MRWTHAYVIMSKVVRTYLYNPENRLIIRFIRVLAYGVYFMVFLYLQYDITNHKAKKEDPDYLLYLKYFIAIEIMSYYAQILNMSLFLLYVTLRGQFGFKNYEAN